MVLQRKASTGMMMHVTKICELQDSAYMGHQGKLKLIAVSRERKKKKLIWALYSIM